MEINQKLTIGSSSGYLQLGLILITKTGILFWRTEPIIRFPSDSLFHLCEKLKSFFFFPEPKLQVLHKSKESTNKRQMLVSCFFTPNNMPEGWFLVGM
jgi:hypothetical protein